VLFVTMLHTDTGSQQELRLQTQRERKLDQQLKFCEGGLNIQVRCNKQLLEKVAAKDQRLTKLRKDKEDATTQNTQLQQQLEQLMVRTQQQSQLLDECRQNYSGLLETILAGEELKKELVECQDKLAESEQLVQQLKQSAEREQVPAWVNTSFDGGNASSLQTNDFQIFQEVFGKFYLICSLSLRPTLNLRYHGVQHQVTKAVGLHRKSFSL